MFKSSDKKPNETVKKEPTPVSSKSPRPDNQTPSIIGADVRLKGNLTTAGEVQFDGFIEGDLHCGSLTVGQNAEISGGIVADNVVIHGKVSGTIRAKTVRLERSSRVVGDVLHEDLAIESGAFIEGHCKRIENALAGSSQQSTPPAKPAQPVEKAAQ